MRGPRGCAIAFCLLLGALNGGLARSQQSEPRSQEAQQPSLALRPDFGENVAGGQPGLFMQVPVSPLSPGAQPNAPTIRNPAQGDPQAPERGLRYFISLNCVGCHAPNGGGGMGPSLSNSVFIYGDEPAQIYLSIFQGRPNGMPAWGAMLPDSVIWDLVTYIGRISNEPTPEWGRTFSHTPLSPAHQQVPTGQILTSDPWSNTMKFGSGRKP